MSRSILVQPGRVLLWIGVSAVVAAAVVLLAHHLPARVKLIGVFPAVVGLLIGLVTAVLARAANVDKPESAEEPPTLRRVRWRLIAALLLGAAAHIGLTTLDHREYVAHLNRSSPDLTDLPPELRAAALEGERSELLGRILLHEALESDDPETRAAAEEQLRRLEARDRRRAEQRSLSAFLQWRLEGVRVITGELPASAAFVVWIVEALLAGLAAAFGATLLTRAVHRWARGNP